MLKLYQIALNSADLPGSLQLYATVFGFRNSGNTPIWGDTAAVQGLGPDCRALVWWMIGADEFFQLELFTHTVPAQRPRPADWRPCDHGWVRFGIAVKDFDATLAAAANLGIHPIGTTVAKGERRHTAIMDPYSLVVIEIIENAHADDEGPHIVYATSSVADLGAARRFHEELLGLAIEPLEKLHSGEDEALWGLGGATRDGFLANAGGHYLEILHYADGRPEPDDRRLCDQGIMNIALGARSRLPVEAALKRLGNGGFVPPHIVDWGESLCGYITERGHEVELAAIPESFDSVIGFTPAAPFLSM